MAERFLSHVLADPGAPRQAVPSRGAAIQEGVFRRLPWSTGELTRSFDRSGTKERVIDHRSP